MPKKNYVSITIQRRIYDRFYKQYEADREELKMSGITSFAGYLVSLASKGLDA